MKGAQYAVGTVDAIHIASAEEIYREGLRLPFVTADARQAEAARVIGLDVVGIGL